ncbi:hypothetical protein PBI_MYXUS_61 [Mycobacterium phage Myxus]|uniref:Uncharacterized protein n=3 Tax=Fromanvirus packman TaxID=1034142 RepID=A0A1C9M1K3_9CAUD|nr:hypothetical protein AVV05_gp047 [Mycobacterium phage Pioneer]YP_009301885.1 hypothetical protein BJD80_gp048 [Mycobacterium phage Catalina]AMO43929.1 hypothetical protein PBI_MYXUS_61 [Mycobacterium phage Myxus]AOQ29018.1 hypothetical protein SEA_HORTUMSL17_62 [Mycobacterium phage HortumSL17]AVI04242.1 hypothetical protein SEA_PHONNEGUT_62 [Mycobacterium phage Phonnegut]AVI04397.1 hypothetical protein SEA_SCHERZO_62 [Mycobacterium phage Scherzo]QBI96378.1 hypothetical protein SEA_UGENIE5_
MSDEDVMIPAEPPTVPLNTPTIDSLVITVDYIEDRLEIHAPYPVKVIQRQTNDMLDGVSVIFEAARPGEL